VLTVCKHEMPNSLCLYGKSPGGKGETVLMASLPGNLARSSHFYSCKSGSHVFIVGVD
jgi:hypothetical protein